MNRRRSIALHTTRLKLSTSDWARARVADWFGAEALASLPTYSRGPSVGRPKGWLVFRRAAEAGWCADCQAPLRVGQMADAWVGQHQFTARDDAMPGVWCGRTQGLAGSRSVLGAAYREQDARQRAQAEADWQLVKADHQARREAGEL